MRNADLMELPNRAALLVTGRLTPEVEALANHLKRNVYDDALLLAKRTETYLRREHGLKYRLGVDTPRGADPVQHFLFRAKAGHCEYFASAMAVLMRANNVPARVVGGYVVEGAGMAGGWRSVTNRHAHAWCEVWIPGFGWMPFDPTGADERIASVGAADAAAAAAAEAAAVAAGTSGAPMKPQEWWSSALAYDSKDQRQVYDRVRGSWEEARAWVGDVIAALGAIIPRRDDTVLVNVMKSLALGLSAGGLTLLVIWIRGRAQLAAAAGIAGTTAPRSLVRVLTGFLNALRRAGFPTKTSTETLAEYLLRCDAAKAVRWASEQPRAIAQQIMSRWNHARWGDPATRGGIEREIRESTHAMVRAGVSVRRGA
jgi:hypothetical protein